MIIRLVAVQKRVLVRSKWYHRLLQAKVGFPQELQLLKERAKDLSGQKKKSPAASITKNAKLAIIRNFNLFNEKKSLTVSTEFFEGSCRIQGFLGEALFE